MAETKVQRAEREAAVEAGQPEQSGEDTSGVQTAEGAVSTTATPREAALATGDLTNAGYGFPAFELEELVEARDRATGRGDFASQGGWATPATSNNVVLQSSKQPVGKVTGTTIVNAGPVDGHVRAYTLAEVEQMISYLERQ